MKYPRYSSLVNSKVGWLGKVPEHWKVCSLKRLTPVFRGASPRPIEDPKYFDDEGEYSWVRIADVTANSHYLTNTTQKLSEIGKSFSVPLEPGELFLSIAGSVGKPMISKIKCCIHDGFVYFPYYDGNVEFLYYIFESGQPYLGLGKLGTQLNLNTDTVGNIKMAFPPREEQDKIVAFLDYKTYQIDQLIEKKEALIERLKEKLIAVTNKAISKGVDDSVNLKPSGVDWLGCIPEHWDVLRAKFVADVFVPQRNKPELNLSEGMPWITMEDMKGDYISEAKLFVSEDEQSNAGSKILKKNSVIASCVGNFGIATVNSIDVIINQQLQAFIPRSINSDFLREVILVSKVYFELIGTSATIVYVNQLGFENMPVPLPSEKEQMVIVSYLKQEKLKYQKMIRTIEEAIACLQEYRSAIITSAVTGKIDVREIELTSE